MAFDYTNLYPDTSGNGGYTKSWNYTTVTDSIAVCSASGYFNKVATRLGIGDNIVIARVDAFPTSTRTALVEYATLYVNGISGGVVTTTPSTTGLATTVYVDAGDASVASTSAAATALKANIANPTFTGTATFGVVAVSTSLTTPINYGGSAAGSTALINGTSSGSPASSFVNIQSNGQFVSIGNTSPKTKLDINANLTQSPALASSASLLRMQAADGASGGFELVNYGNSVATANVLGGVAAGGTAAVPSTTLNGQHMFNMSGYGYNAGFVKGGIWLIYASENWTASAQGTQQDWYITPNGTTTLTQAMSLKNSGGLSLGGSLTDPGAGAFIAAGSIKSTSGVGYATGAGGTVTQATNKSTGVTLSKASGAITMNAAALAAGTIVSFVMTNTSIAATDVLVLNHISGGTVGSYLLNAQCAAGSATINVRNETAGSLSEAIVIQFALIKAVNA